MPGVPDSQRKILHLVGSTVSDYYFNLSLMYARVCDSEPKLDRVLNKYMFCLVYPNGDWAFPTSLAEADIESTESLTVAEATAKIAGMQLDLMVPHMFCVEGASTCRSLFDLLRVPYLGCPGASMFLTADKAQTRGVMAAHNVSIPAGEVLRRGERPTMAPPLVLKPAREDNSLGVVLVKTEADMESALETAFSFDTKIVCEEFIAGREVRAGLLEEDDGSFSLLPMTEYFLADIRTSAHKLATDDKGNPLTDGSAIVKTEGDRKCPADVTPELAETIKTMCIRAHKALGCKDYSLYDIRINEEGVPFFLEACNFCSMSPKSALIAMGNAAGRQHPEIYNMLTERALNRQKELLRSEQKGALPAFIG